MRVGVIGSSGGSALKAAVQIYESSAQSIQLVILTDRDCGLSTWARSINCTFLQRPYNSAESFSAWADAEFERHGCADVILFYTRRVAAPLIDNRNVWNIHPALLPSFPGLHSLADARRAGVSLFGATLHRVDATLDTGPIKVQICSPMPATNCVPRSERLSYIHKVWLTLIWLETLAGNHADGPFMHSWHGGAVLCSASISSRVLEDQFLRWLSQTETDEQEGECE